MSLRLALSSFALAIAGLCTAVPAHADTYTYTYTGKDFTFVFGQYKTSDSMTGSVTLATELGQSMSLTNVPFLSFSFYDGVQTLSSANGATGGFQFSTDSYGTIQEWEVALSGLSQHIATNNYSINVGDLGFSDVTGENSDMPGSWKETRNATTVPSTVTPEPTPFWLLATGGLGILGAARRRFKA